MAGAARAGAESPRGIVAPRVRRFGLLFLVLVPPALCGAWLGWRAGRAALFAALEPRAARPAGVEALWQAIERHPPGPRRAAAAEAARARLAADARTHPEVPWLLALAGLAPPPEAAAPAWPDEAAAWVRARWRALSAGPERAALGRAFAQRWPGAWAAAPMAARDAEAR